MGQAHQRQQSIEARLEFVRAAATRTAIALQKLADAASAQQGLDCFVHAELGRAVLQDMGVSCQTVVGHAAWRVGCGDSDVVAHVAPVPSFLPPGVKGKAYHAWLQSDGILIDLTTYQLRRKAEMLDELDGGSTTVLWCPPVLVTPINTVAPYAAVAQAPGPGVYFYRADPALQLEVEAEASLCEEDLDMLRMIVANPNAKVIGPNHMTATTGD